MKRGFVMVANSLVAVGLLALAGLTSSAAAFASAAPAAVISGPWYFAYGARYDERALKELPPGSFYTGPSNQPYFARTGDAPVGVYISGHGSTGTPYVLTDEPANRSEEGWPQIGWLLPAPQSCSRVVSALAGGGSKDRY